MIRDTRPFPANFRELPAYLPGTASLVEHLDRRLLVVLRDGRHLVGILKSFDQFMNLRLDEAAERVTFQGELESRLLYFLIVYIDVDKYSDFPLGIYLVR